MVTPPPERSPDASTMYGSRTTRNPTLSTKKRKIRRGESQKMNQGTVFWWGERGLARAGGRAEL